jgi:hypothetical protein
MLLLNMCMSFSLTTFVFPFVTVLELYSCFVIVAVHNGFIMYAVGL